MTKYKCETCQNVFSHKGHLNDHKNNKLCCKKDNEIEEHIEKKVQEVLSKTNDGVVKIDTITLTKTSIMDYSKKTCKELFVICKEKNIKGYSKKKKEDIINLIQDKEPKQIEMTESKNDMTNDITNDMVNDMVNDITNDTNIIFIYLCGLELSTVDESKIDYCQHVIYPGFLYLLKLEKDYFRLTSG